MLALAADVAKGKEKNLDNRSFFLGAVGLRNDGVIVTAKNIASSNVAPDHHAETRVIRKITPNSTVWVARVLRSTGEWSMSRPCSGCQMRMRSAGVKKVVYTIAPNEWGSIELNG